MSGSSKILSKTTDKRYMFMIWAFIIFDIAICDINKYMLRSSEDKVLPTLGVGIRQIILIKIITYESLVL